MINSKPNQTKNTMKSIVGKFPQFFPHHKTDGQNNINIENDPIQSKVKKEEKIVPKAIQFLEKDSNPNTSL